MKGILKVYHPEETLKYHIKSSYCKPVYSNQKHYLEVEVITNDDLDHVDDDSLQYNFPQLALNISDFPIESDSLIGKTFLISDTEDDFYTSTNLFDDEEAFIYDNELSFTEDENKELQLFWKGYIDDFYTGSGELIPFKLKCHFREDDMDIDE